MVNQVQLHTRLSQEDLVRYCHDHNIVVTAFCPLSGSDLTAPVLTELSQAHGVSPAIVVLRWLMQRGIAAIPKTLTQGRLAEVCLSSRARNSTLAPAANTTRHSNEHALQRLFRVFRMPRL